MNWYDVAHFVLNMIGVLLLAMIFIEYIEDQREKHRSYTLTTETHIPTTTWVLETRFRELTDKEILEEWPDEPLNYDGEREVIDFARTVIRKAQEK